MMAALQLAVQLRATSLVAPQVIAQSALLELDYLALEERITRELTENPALESQHRPPAGESLPLSSHADLLNQNTTSTAGDEIAESAPLEDTLAAPYTLREDLAWQFRLTAPRALRDLGLRLIESVEDSGYLRADIGEVAAELGLPVARVQEALDYLQGLDPPGVGARTLSECLLLQVWRLREQGQAVPWGTERVLEACNGTIRWDLAADLARRSGMRRSQVETILDFVRRRLTPYPGGAAQLSPPLPEPGMRLYPDVIVRLEGERFHVEIPRSRAHDLQLSRTYLALERARREAKSAGLAPGAPEAGPGEATVARSEETEPRALLERAQAFLRLLQRREVVLRQVTEAVIAWQRGFLLHGPVQHQPLTKKQIAMLTGLSESTVCRATRGKCVMLPSGEVVSFDIFFAPAVPAQHELARLVGQEPAGQPFSDEALARELRAAGYDLARRTVAKYRHALGLPCAAARRRLSHGRE
jgi:RNA polymerase sigma-54 factor